MSESRKLPLLLVADRSLYGSATCRELLDMVFTAAAFGQNVALLIRGEACCWVASSDLAADALEQQDLQQMLAQLPMYGVEGVYINQNDLERLAPQPAIDGTILVNDTEMKALYRRFHQVIHL